MPREHQKRGRREQKRKREAVDDGSEHGSTGSPPPKRQFSPPPEDTQHEQQDYIPITADGVTSTPPQADEFYGHLSLDDAEYFKRADAMLELDNFDSASERELFLASVWREAASKELKLACAQSCSRVLERLVKASSAKQLKRLWGSFKDHFLFLVQHRFASHVCEALFLRAAPVVTSEMVGEDSQEVEEEDDENEHVKMSMESLFLQVVEELSQDMGYLMTDRFASHALRVLLVILGGKPLDHSATTSLLQSKSKERLDTAKGTQSDEPVRHTWRTVPKSFHDALQKIASKTVGSLDAHYLRALATHPIGNPVMQVLLELEFISQGKQNVNSSDDSLFRRLLPDDSPTEGTQSANFVKDLLYDTVGSRLLEVIVQQSPGKTFKTIYRALFRDHLSTILKNDVASFVCIRIFERLGREDLKQAVEAIAPEIPTLIERARHSVIRVIIERCRVREVQVQPLVDAFEKTYRDAGSDRVKAILLLGHSSPESSSGLPESTVQTTQKLHASLLVQTILAQPDALREYINNTFLNTKPLSLVEVACDRQATHALQKSLNAPSQDHRFRRLLISILFGHFVELANDTVGSYVLDSVWDATNGGLLFLRERVAEEMVQHEAQIKSTFCGRAVLRRWSLDLYQRRKEEWINRTKRSEGGTNGDPQGASQKPKSAIEKARERFAAEGKNKRGGVRRNIRPTGSRGNTNMAVSAR